MNIVGPPDGLRPRLGEPKMAYFPNLDQLLHRADGLLYRHLRVHPMLVVEVYVIHP